MSAALLIAKHHSGGVPGKNYMQLLGRPVVEYPLMAAYHCDRIDTIYVSTDSPIVKDIAKNYGAKIIDRPEYLAKSESPTEDVFEHAYSIVKETEKNIDYMALMFGNSIDVLPDYLAQAIDQLETDQSLDSVISVSKYNMFTPLRARSLDLETNTSTPLLDLNALGIDNTFDRDAMGDIYFADFGVQMVRPERCLLDARAGALPFRWLGKKQGSIIKPFGFDIDDHWQIPVMEYWLTEHGFTKTATIYD